MQVILKNNIAINLNLVEHYSVYLKNNSKTGLAEYGVNFIFPDKTCIRIEGLNKSKEEAINLFKKVKQAVLENKEAVDLTNENGITN